MDEGDDSRAAGPTPSAAPLDPGAPTPAASDWPRNALTIALPASDTKISPVPSSKQTPHGESSIAAFGLLDDRKPLFPEPITQARAPYEIAETQFDPARATTTDDLDVRHMPYGGGDAEPSSLEAEANVPAPHIRLPAP